MTLAVLQPSEFGSLFYGKGASGHEPVVHARPFRIAQYRVIGRGVPADDDQTVAVRAGLVQIALDSTSDVQAVIRHVPQFSPRSLGRQLYRADRATVQDQDYGHDDGDQDCAEPIERAAYAGVPFDIHGLSVDHALRAVKGAA